MQPKSQEPIANSSTKSLILYLDTSKPEAVLSLYSWQGETLPEEGLSLVRREAWLAHRELSATLTQKYSYILKNVGMSSRDLLGVCVFVGPGSFTGLRIGISFANALAFGLGVPIYETKKKGEINLKNPKGIAVPFYGAPPRITKPKKR